MPERTCIVCGRIFPASHGAQRLCSAACRLERSRYHQRHFKAMGISGPQCKTCIVCGREFRAGVGEGRPTHAKTCGQACQVARLRQIESRRYATLRADRLRPCVECGQLFRVIERPRRKTCSERCAQHRRSDQTARCGQNRKARGIIAADNTRRRASGYMKRYKRQWRRRRAEEAARMELLVLTTAALPASRKPKGDSDGNHS